MAPLFRLSALALLAALSTPPLAAETVSVRNGSDLFLSGSSAFPALSGPGDVFATGQSVVIQGSVGGDTHAAGFDISVEAPVAGDLYAAGFSIAVLAPVSEDLTMAGFSLRTSAAAATTGNARMAGGTVVIDGPVGGALTVAGGEVTLNATITGDVLISAQTLSFGPGARILGRLTYATPEKVEIPASVIAAGKVSWEKLTVPEVMANIGEEIGQTSIPPVPAVGMAVSALAMTLVFLVVLAAVLLAFAPQRVERMRRAAVQRPGVAILAGFIGLSALFGAVPVMAMTIIGIPLLPFALLAIFLGWMLGYLLGVYGVSLRLAQAFGLAEEAGLLLRVVVLALGLAVAALLNFVPILGWVMNFLLVLLGTGGMALVMVGRGVEPTLPPQGPAG